MNFPGGTFLFLSGGMLQYSHRNHFPHDLVTRLFLQSLQYWIGVQGFLGALLSMPIISIFNVPRIMGTLVIAWKEGIVYDDHYTCLCTRKSGNLSCKPAIPQQNFSYNAQSQMSVTSQCSISNMWKMQWLSWEGYFYSWCYSRCWWWNSCWMECDFTILPRGRIFVMFGPVVTTEAFLAFPGARTHSNNTAEMTATVKALSFLGAHGPVAGDEQSCIYYDSLHGGGVCWGTIQARTHVQLALACQRCMISAQRKFRLTMERVYGHSGNLGNQCADHAAALGALGFTSNQNVVTRCIVWRTHGVGETWFA